MRNVAQPTRRSSCLAGRGTPGSASVAREDKTWRELRGFLDKRLTPIGFPKGVICNGLFDAIRPAN